MATEVYFNDVGTALSSGIDNSTTSITVNSVASMPNPFTSSQFRIRIDDEIMIVTAINAGTRVLTVTRGAESTGAVPHSSGAQVIHILTAGALQGLLGQITGNNIGAQASLPASYALAGTAYYGNDKPYVNVWNGSAYSQYYAPFAVPPLPAASWTQVNINAVTNMTSGDSLGGVFVKSQGAAGGPNRGLFVAVPSTPYKVAMHLKFVCASNDSNSWGGAYWLDSTSSPNKFTMIVMRGNNTFIMYNGSSFSSGPGYNTINDPNASTAGMIGSDLRVILEDDGTTNRTVSFSNDGYNYITAPNWPRARTDNSTYPYIGFGGQGSTGWVTTLVSYRVF